MNRFIVVIGIALLSLGCGETTVQKPPVSEPDAATPRPPTAASVKTTDATPRPAKVVSLSIIDLEEAQKATVRVGDTLEVTVPIWPGTGRSSASSPRGVTSLRHGL